MANKAHDFRHLAPIRDCDKTYKSYRSFKRFLVSDFNGRCGYCHSSHTWHGGSKYYHIDHFAPKSMFPALETNYDNLVYSCPLCNLAKSDKWPSTSASQNIVAGLGYIDPCRIDYNTHFYRDKKGFIHGNTSVAKHMVKELKLNLEIHSVTWELSRLEQVIDKYKLTLMKVDLDINVRQKAESIHYKLLQIFYDYFGRLKELKK